MGERHAGARPRDAAIGTAALESWLADRVAVTGPIDVRLIAEGHSNLTYRISDRGGRRFVLRRPPRGRLAGTAHDMRRESTIIDALGPTEVPVPRVLGYDEDPKISDAPFFVMEFVGGSTISDRSAALAMPEAARRRVGPEMAATLAKLHRVDPVKLGLGHLLRDEGLIERQLRRWHRQLQGYAELTTVLSERVYEALSARVPAPQRTSLVHGDFKMGNLRLGADGTILTVLDWELGAVGNPLVDVGWLLASWAEPEDSARWIVEPPTLVPGFGSRAELLSVLEARSGLDLDEVDYYVAFSYWRWSCINEGILARFDRGAMANKQIDFDAIRAQIRWQLSAAMSLLSGRSTVAAKPKGSTAWT
jgi:aminoglycoside phosphotransferase (APT) family kinase protein